MTDHLYSPSDLSLRIEMKLKDPTYHQGELMFIPATWDEWSETQPGRDGECRHDRTICSQCADSWAEDYWIRLVHVATGNIIGVNGVPGLVNLSDITELDKNEGDSDV